MATVKIKGSLSIERVYVTPTCPACMERVQYHLKRPVTRKLCVKCGKVELFFTVKPLVGWVNISCHYMNGFQPGVLELSSEDVEIVDEEEEGE